MRLLLITNRYPYDTDDPASPFVPHFVEALRTFGVDVDVLTPRYNHRPPAPEPLFIHRFETGASRPVGSWNLISPFAWVRLARFMKSGLDLGRKLCQERQYDHILALWALPSGEFARRLSHEFGVSYSVWCLGSDIYVWSRKALIRGQIRRVLLQADHRFGDGEDLCSRVTGWLGVSCDFLPSYRPLGSDFQSQFPRSTKAPRFLYLGRVHRAKGVEELVAAFARVHRAMPAATLRIVGDGPHLRKLRQRVLAMKLGAAADFSGSVGGDEILDAYRRCDFVVIPTKSDSLPLVFSEAVQMNRPVIGTDVGDVGTLIRRYRLGLVCAKPLCDHLAEAMLEMSARPIFDAAGRDALLKLLDPQHAAATFCERVSGSGGLHRTSTPPTAVNRAPQAAEPAAM